MAGIASPQNKSMGRAAIKARRDTCVEKARKLKHEMSVKEIETKYLSIQLRLAALIGHKKPEKNTDLTQDDIKLFLDISRRWRQNLDRNGLKDVEIFDQEVFAIAKHLDTIFSE